MKPIRILALDPSVNRCGYASAVFEPREGFKYPDVDQQGNVIEAVAPQSWKEETSVWSWGYFDMQAIGYIARLHEICGFIELIFPEGFDILICEWPAFYDVERGHVAAVRGDTMNLAGINCFVAGWFRVPTNRLTFITAAKWKGSVSKEITMQRFLRSFGVHKIYSVDHNAVDAAMILLTWCTRAKLVHPPTFVPLQKRLDPMRMKEFPAVRQSRNHRL